MRRIHVGYDDSEVLKPEVRAARSGRVDASWSVECNEFNLLVAECHGEGVRRCGNAEQPLGALIVDDAAADSVEPQGIPIERLRPSEAGDRYVDALDLQYRGVAEASGCQQGKRRKPPEPGTTTSGELVSGSAHESLGPEKPVESGDGPASVGPRHHREFMQVSRVYHGGAVTKM